MSFVEPTCFRIAHAVHDVAFFSVRASTKKNKISVTGTHTMKIAKLLARYPDRIPTQVHRHSATVPIIKRTKFLIPKDHTLGQVLMLIRKEIKLQPEVALFLFVRKQTMLPSSSIIGHIYDEYKSESGLLDIYYCGENTFGAFN